MKPAVVAHPDYGLAVEGSGRFPSGKFAALHARLLRCGLLARQRCYRPRHAGFATLSSVHDPAYVRAVLAGHLDRRKVRDLGLVPTPALIRRARAAVGGTVLAAKLARDFGVACNLAGGSHHAGVARPSGFCLFNDVAVAIGVLRAAGVGGPVLVVDLDVHQGDGTAMIFAREPEVVTLSVHCRTNFPVRKARSTLDVALEPRTRDRIYLRTLQALLQPLLARVRPTLAFYNAGVDPHRDDRLGRLALSESGLAERDALVLDSLRRAGVPVVCVVGGGYGDIDQIAARHAITHEVLADLADW